MKRSSSVSTVN